jgi:hypothetical protein
MKWVIVLHVILDKVELVSLLGDLLGTLALGRYYDGWPVMVGYVLNIHAHARVCRKT